mgnify:CR=1 FL=1
MYLEGKTAIITGSTSGIGLGIARSLANQGANIVFNSFTNLESDYNLAENLAKEFSVKVSYACADMRNPQECRDLITSQSACDILVNNAGIVINRVPIEQRTVEEWDRVQAVNSRGVFLGTKHAIPAMRLSGGGSIINICSIAGYGQSTTQEPAYAASKGAVRIFSKVTATQMAKDNIRSNAIFPGPIDTEMVHAAMSDPKVLAERLTRVPMGRLGLVKEIVAGVIFLASDESSYMTGGELVIDGGATSM